MMTFPRLLPWLFWLSITGFCHAQISTSLPVFKTRADSLRYAQLNAQLTAAFQSKDFAKAHQLMDSLARLRGRTVTGFVQRYQPRFLTLDSALRLPEEEKATLTKLTVTGRQVTSVPTAVFQFPALQELELTETAIRKVPRTLRKIWSLQHVSVINPQGKQRLKLGRNRNIAHLTLRLASPDRLPRTYRALPALEKLDLSYCALTEIPQRLHHNKKLRSLLLNHNGLTLRQPFRGHPSLQQLELRSNKIQTVPEGIAGFPALKRLIFTNNEITQVSPALAQLQQLTEVAFYNNRLTEVPEALYQIGTLREIDLYYNQIERLSPKVNQWKSVEVLYLSNNKFFSLPDELGSLPQLKELYLSNNRLSALPTTLAQLSSLKVLRVNNNYLSEVPASIFHLPVLENIDISRNKITEVDERLFNKQGLKILALVGNDWDLVVRDRLPGWAEQLRKTGTIVHLNTFEDSVDADR